LDSKSYAVVTTFGTDRPGIVEDVSHWLLEQGGNIEDSRMSLLGGEFATLILVSGPPDMASKIEQSREGFQKRHSGTPSGSVGPALRYILKATSLDHPGIVHQVSSLLRRQSINIVSAETRTTPAPFTSAPVFQFQMEIDIPAQVTIGRLRDELRVLGDKENIDFMLTAASEV
jgi:glycine cleavage system transcriptional repressor